MNTAGKSTDRSGRRRLLDRVEAWIDRYPNTFTLISQVLVPVIAAVVAFAVAVMAR